LLRKPRGGYFDARTKASASSGVFTIGHTMPYTPASQVLPMMAGSFHGTRARGIVVVVEIAASIVTIAW
jgi:hypothetical protein